MVLDINSLNNAVISYYTFDEDTGSVAGDSKATNDGTINGAIWTTGKIGNALSFDGVDDYVDTNNNFEHFHTTGEGAISLWAKFDTAKAHYLVANADDSGSPSVNGFLTIVDSNLGNMHLRVTREGGIADVYIADYNFNLNQFYHLVFQRSSTGDINLFVNGQEITGSFAKQTFTTGTGTSSNVNIGRSPVRGDRFTEGDIDEPAIFDRVLNQDEVDFLYASGSPTSEQQYEFGAFVVSTQAATNIFSDQANLNAEVTDFE